MRLVGSCCSRKQSPFFPRTKHTSWTHWMKKQLEYYWVVNSATTVHFLNVSDTNIHFLYRWSLLTSEFPNISMPIQYNLRIILCIACYISDFASYLYNRPTTQTYEACRVHAYSKCIRAGQLTVKRPSLNRGIIVSTSFKPPQGAHQPSLKWPFVCSFHG